MKSPAAAMHDAISDFGIYIDDAFGGHAPQVCAAWHEVLRAIDAHVQKASLAPGLYVRRVEYDPCPGERDADDQRVVVRLKFVSDIVPNVVMHLSTEDIDPLPRLDLLTKMRRGVGLLERSWDDLDPAEAIARFVDHHNARAAIEGV